MHNQKKVEAFQAVVLELVSKRDEKTGALPAKSRMPLMWRKLTDSEKLEVAKWVNQNVRQCASQLQAVKARSFVEVKERLLGYPK